MAISSVSRVYDAPDPILEADLELLGKVNTYEQSKYDMGAAALQGEVNNWALMTQIAKPELKQYASQKLSNLITGLNSLGGVNLADANNVNALKSMGYNIYADKRIVDGVATTQRMKALSASSQAKLSGKDADKYDPAVADYLMKGYADWASDGNPDNARYDGPVDLPMGNMNTINAKVSTYLKGLTPDSDSRPVGDLEKSYGYFQFEGKWLKGNRIEEAINAVTDQNDALIFKAHGWKALAGDSDAGLINKLGVIYESTASSIKNQINYLQAELNQTTDGGRKREITNLIAQQRQALARNDEEKSGWYTKEKLSPTERDGIQESLYKNAWKSNVTNSFSYNQERKELKSNMPLIFKDRMDMQAYQWSKDYKLRVEDFELKKIKTFFDMDQTKLKNSLTGGLNNPFGIPLTQEANKGETNQQADPTKFMDKINSTYFALNSGYYDHLYNIMGSNDAAGRFVKTSAGWKPKPEYKDQIEKEISLFSSKLDNYSNLTDAEKKNLNIPVGEDELKQIFDVRNQINTYRTYKTMAEEKESEIINHAIASNTIGFDWRNVPISIGNDGSTRMTVGELLALNEAGVYGDDIAIAGVGLKPGSSESYFDTHDLTMKSLKKQVEKMRTSAKSSYEKIGGNMFNSFNVPIPFESIPKSSQEIIQKQLTNKISGVDYNSIQPIRGKIEFNFETGKPEYKLEVQSGTAKKLKSETIDVTDMIQTSPNSGLGIYFPKSDISLVWGLSLNKNGATPFSKQDGYKDALRTQGSNYPYQVSTMPNAVNGTAGLKVKVGLPVGGGEIVEVNVKNLSNNSFVFPSSLEAVQQYLNDWLSTPTLKAKFYEAHGLTQ